MKTPSLTKEDAVLAVQMLNTVSMRLDQAPQGLRVIGSLMRIAEGRDKVAPVDNVPAANSGSGV